MYIYILKIQYMFFCKNQIGMLHIKNHLIFLLQINNVYSCIIVTSLVRWSDCLQ